MRAGSGKLESPWKSCIPEYFAHGRTREVWRDDILTRPGGGLNPAHGFRIPKPLSPNDSISFPVRVSSC
jgi:hypothetical protein